MTNLSFGAKLPLGAIHGRFQPFHNGHFDYLRQVLRRAEHVVIQLTSPDPGARQRESSGDHRHKAASNPYSFYERSQMILQSLGEEDRSRATVVPFDLSNTDNWTNFTPLEAVQFVTVHEEWDSKKAQRFADFGYRVEFLKPNQQRVSGTDVRALMQTGGDWHLFVPRGTESVIRALSSSETESPLTEMRRDDGAW